MSLIGSISAIKGRDTKRAKASLQVIERNGNPGERREFQYFPESISDTRGVDYVSKNAVGSSHPIYQWTHGSPRGLSFDVTFTSDYDGDAVQNTSSPDTSSSPVSNAMSMASNIMGRVSEISRNPVAAAVQLIKGQGKDPLFDREIADDINWLRQFTYPDYQGTKALPPKKLLLHLPGSGIRVGIKSIPLGVIPVLMTQCDVTYEAFFRNGHPRIAVVHLGFVETIQYGKSWKYANGPSIGIGITRR